MSIINTWEMKKHIKLQTYFSLVMKSKKMKSMSKLNQLIALFLDQENAYLFARISRFFNQKKGQI